MNNNIDKIIKFSLTGKFAHFKKFYTNSSSLSYLIPPRTTIIGLIASILKIKRDEYYEILNEKNLKVSVCIPENLEIRKQMQSLNYLHNFYYNLITKGKGKVQHSQCKFELLMFPLEKKIEYNIYLGFNQTNETINKFEEKLIKNDLGFGVYFGQRQFKADIEFKSSFIDSDIVFYSESEFLDSLCSEENFYELSSELNTDVLSEQMPINFRQIKDKKNIEREPISVKKIFFEKKGKRLKGKFGNCYFVDKKYISFY